MLNKTELMLLERALSEEHVLSAYVDGTGADLANHSRWRLDLAQAISALRLSLADAPQAERAELERCIDCLTRAVDLLPANPGAPGWVAFVTAEGVQHSGRLPVPEPTRAIWTKGPALAPYISALTELRPVVLVVANARRGRIHVYRAGDLSAAKTAHARAHPGDHSHFGAASPADFAGGTPGTSDHDAAQKPEMTGVQRMVDELTEQSLKLAGTEGWIVIGGVPRIAARLNAELEPKAPGRVVMIQSLDIRATDAQLLAAARDGASKLRDAEDLSRIREIEYAKDAMLGSIGPIATREALQAHRVRELFLTHRYIEDHTADAEAAVRLALDQGAMIEEVSHSAAERLDALGGICARLRQPPRTR